MVGWCWFLPFGGSSAYHRQRITQCTSKDREVVDAITALLKEGPQTIQNDIAEWAHEDGLTLRRGRVYVPKDEQLRRDIVKEFHDSPAAGHPGHWKTTELIQRSYWWPGMNLFIKNYVLGCATCQTAKPITNPMIPPLNPITSSSAIPFRTVSMDFITDLPLSKGFDACLVVVDHDVSKGVVFIPCTKTTDAKKTAELYRDHVWKRFGLPDKIISDRGPQFASKFFGELCRLLGIKRSMSTAYHPQSDGGTERVNQELEMYLRIFCNYRGEDWADRLAVAEFCHNNRQHSSTKLTPFFLLSGSHPRAFTSITPTTQLPTIERRISDLIKLREETQSSLKVAADLMIEHAKVPSFTPYAKGQMVWLSAKNIRSTHPSAKLAPRRYGPFSITDVLSPLTYRLKLPKTWKIHPVFHALLLHPYKETTEHGPNFLRPPPDIINDEEEYEVEQILESRFIRKRIQYLVKWKGYPDSNNLWLPKSLLRNAKELITQFHQEHPNAPQL